MRFVCCCTKILLYKLLELQVYSALIKLFPDGQYQIACVGFDETEKPVPLINPSAYSAPRAYHNLYVLPTHLLPNSSWACYYWIDVSNLTYVKRQFFVSYALLQMASDPLQHKTRFGFVTSFEYRLSHLLFSIVGKPVTPANFTILLLLLLSSAFPLLLPQYTRLAIRYNRSHVLAPYMLALNIRRWIISRHIVHTYLYQSSASWYKKRVSKL